MDAELGSVFASSVSSASAATEDRTTSLARSPITAAAPSGSPRGVRARPRGPRAGLWFPPRPCLDRRGSPVQRSGSGAWWSDPTWRENLNVALDFLGGQG